MHGHQQFSAKIAEYVRTGTLDVSDLPINKMDVPSRGIHVLSLGVSPSVIQNEEYLEELFLRGGRHWPINIVDIIRANGEDDPGP